MDQLIEKAPYLAAVILTMLIFVTAYAKESKRRDTFEIARLAELEKIGEACHAHTKELNERTNATIENNSRIIEANTKIIGAIERRMNGGR